MADRLSVDEARKLARKYLSQVDHGNDPLGERKAKEQASTTTFKAVAEAYLDDLAAKGNRTVEGYRSALERLVFPKFGTWQVTDIRRTHIKSLVRTSGRSKGRPLLMARWRLCVVS